MTIAPDFFDTEQRNWRARLAVSVEVMRELSRYSDPEEMHTVFSRRMAQLFPVSRQLSISRRGLDSPVSSYSIQPVDRSGESLEGSIFSRFTRGVLAELLYGDQPKMIESWRSIWTTRRMRTFPASDRC